MWYNSYVKRIEKFTATAATAAMFVLPFIAFTTEVRKFIGKRDKWTCQNCGRRFRDGWMVQAAHYNHDRQSVEYNNPDNGRILCLECHLREHLEKNDIRSAQLIARHIWNNGFHTTSWTGRRRTNIDRDREKLVSILDEYANASNLTVW